MTCKNKPEESNIREIPKIVEKAREAYQRWRLVSLEERVKLIRRISSEIRKRRKDIAEINTKEMGKPIKAAIAESDSAADETDFYCRNAKDYLKDEPHDKNNKTVYAPLGVVAVISPWNYPVTTPISSLVPALLCGNSVILKPSEYTPKTGILLAEIFKKFLPESVFQVIIGGKDHGETLVKSDIDLVSFTGSQTAGKSIMRNCSYKLHDMVLELGGLDAAIVLKDADVRKTAESILKANIRNSGQVCCAVKRVYVEKNVYKKFVSEISKFSKKVKLGDPLSDVDMGPLVGGFQLKKVEDFVGDALKKGAKAVSGGEKIKGNFYPSTILIDVDHNMKIMNEEAFGPVLPIYPVCSWEEAVRFINDSKYGLTTSVWTGDLRLGEDIAKKIEVGVSWINAHGGGPLGAPWGGTKQSGIGRLSSRGGFRSFCNIQLIRRYKQQDL